MESRCVTCKEWGLQETRLQTVLQLIFPKNIFLSGDARLGTALGAQNVLALKTIFSMRRRK